MALDQIPSALEQHLAVNAFEGHVGVGEVGANVSEGQSTQQRVANDMQEDVCIAVAHGSLFMGDR